MWRKAHGKALAEERAEEAAREAEAEQQERKRPRLTRDDLHGDDGSCQDESISEGVSNHDDSSLDVTSADELEEDMVAAEKYKRRLRSPPSSRRIRGRPASQPRSESPATQSFVQANKAVTEYLKRRMTASSDTSRMNARLENELAENQEQADPTGDPVELFGKACQSSAATPFDRFENSASDSSGHERGEVLTNTVCFLVGESASSCLWCARDHEWWAARRSLGLCLLKFRVCLGPSSAESQNVAIIID